MKWIPMEIGSKRTHEGASHAAKHYLSPAELWEDVAQEVEPDSRPIAILVGALRGELPFGHRGITEAGVAHFRALERAYARGYLTVIERYLGTGIEDARLHDDNPKRSIHHVGDGVIVEVDHRGDSLHMRTAYRPVRASLHTVAAYARLSRGLDELGRRLKTARYRAQRILMRRREEDSP